MHVMRRILWLGAISIGGIALLAPVAARSATSVPVDSTAGLLQRADAPQLLAARGGLSGRLALMAATVEAAQVPEELHPEAVPTPAVAPMEATIHSVTPPRPAPRRVVTYAGDSVWDDLARCESGGNWAINTGNGYYGGLQFSLDTWKGYGGAEFAASPHEATRGEQIIVAERLRAARGYAPWPACRAKLGLP